MKAGETVDDIAWLETWFDESIVKLPYTPVLTGETAEFESSLLFWSLIGFNHASGLFTE